MDLPLKLRAYPNRLTHGADELEASWRHGLSRPIPTLNRARWRKDWVKVPSELAQDRWACSASVRDVINAVGVAGSTRPGWMPTQVQVSKLQASFSCGWWSMVWQLYSPCKLVSGLPISTWWHIGATDLVTNPIFYTVDEPFWIWIIQQLWIDFLHFSSLKVWCWG